MCCNGSVTFRSNIFIDRYDPKISEWCIDDAFKYFNWASRLYVKLIAKRNTFIIQLQIKGILKQRFFHHFYLDLRSSQIAIDPKIIHAIHKRAIKNTLQKVEKFQLEY